MQLQHSFTLPVGVDEAWDVLLDLGAVAPSMPGATLASTAPDAVQGALKVKLGPLNVTYKGAVTPPSADVATHRAVVPAEGVSVRSGSASATVTVTLSPDGDATTVTVDTDLEVTGKPAQFGQGVMSEVGTKLVNGFATALAAELTAGGPSRSAPVETAPTPAPDTVPDAAAEAEATAEATPAGTPDTAAEIEPEDLVEDSRPAGGTPSAADTPAADTPDDETVAADGPPPAPRGREDAADQPAAGRAPINGLAAPTPAPGRPDGAGGVAALTGPVLTRGVAPVAIAAVFVFGAFRRRRGRRRR